MLNVQLLRSCKWFLGQLALYKMLRKILCSHSSSDGSLFIFSQICSALHNRWPVLQNTLLRRILHLEDQLHQTGVCALKLYSFAWQFYCRCHISSFITFTENTPSPFYQLFILFDRPISIQKELSIQKKILVLSSNLLTSFR